jgi:nitrite reductase/ring-hydroxylating ferredoxin subunit
MSEVLFNYLIDKIRRFYWSPFNCLSHVGTYTREIPVSLERMYENALDGEHLPYLHSSSFSYVDILESGPWGWRAKAGLQPRSPLTNMEIKLVLNRDEYCWKTVTLAGLGKGTEIWTHAIPLAEHRIKVIVDFYVPKVPPFLIPLYRDYYLSVYERLYDEDERMMSQRQQALDFKQAQPKVDSDTVALGSRDEVNQNMPFTFTFNKHRYSLTRIGEEYVAYSAICPHMLGPLDEEPVSQGVVTCPWHGYEFDVRTGDCVSGQSCRLKAAPRIEVDPESHQVYARL